MLKGIWRKKKADGSAATLGVSQIDSKARGAANKGSL
jgi:hypothetical protein